MITLIKSFVEQQYRNVRGKYIAWKTNRTYRRIMQGFNVRHSQVFDNENGTISVVSEFEDTSGVWLVFKDGNVVDRKFIPRRTN